MLGNLKLSTPPNICFHVKNIRQIFVFIVLIVFTEETDGGTDGGMGYYCFMKYQYETALMDQDHWCVDIGGLQPHPVVLYRLPDRPHI